ncbi:MAG: ABC-F family ATP-binding cassette domain-containing protein [Gammaproteobacteria bacterium]
MISFSSVSKHYGQRSILVDASFQLNRGDKVGLVGPNGAGKTTLFRLLVGEEHADGGDVAVPRALTIGYVRQDAADLRGRSVIDEVVLGAGRLGELHGELAALERALADGENAGDMDRLVERYGEVQSQYQQSGGYELEARAREVLAGLGFDAAQVDGDVGALSGGWKMRVQMAQVLLAAPDVLLLDEPTNHLDLESILWLEQFLKATPACILMTCHDRDFMNRVITSVVELDAGKLVSYGGNYDFYERECRIRAREAEAAYTRQQAMLAKEERFIERFERHAAKAAQVQSRIKKLDKLDKLEPPKRRVVRPFEMRQAPRSGNDVLMLAGVGKRYGARTVYENFNFEIRRGERWCVLGANGAGKSTLLKMVAGHVQPDSGEVRLGASLKLGYFSQAALDLLDPDATVYEHLDRDFPTAGVATKMGALGAFDFSGDETSKPVRVLSGGERSRLILARMLFDPPNFLVLDEPTNHLDLLTKEMLVQTLSGFDGTMLFVSHDRAFLRGLANRVLDLSGTARGTGPECFRDTYAHWVERYGNEAPGVHH